MHFAKASTQLFFEVQTLLSAGITNTFTLLLPMRCGVGSSQIIGGLAFKSMSAADSSSLCRFVRQAPLAFGCVRLALHPASLCDATACRLVMKNLALLARQLCWSVWRGLSGSRSLWHCRNSRTTRLGVVVRRKCAQCRRSKQYGRLLQEEGSGNTVRTYSMIKPLTRSVPWTG